MSRYSQSTGEAGAFIDRGDNTYGGKFVINPSGGLISKGHPLGATGKSDHHDIGLSGVYCDVLCKYLVLVLSTQCC